MLMEKRMEVIHVLCPLSPVGRAAVAGEGVGGLRCGAITRSFFFGDAGRELTAPPPGRR